MCLWVRASWFSRAREGLAVGEWWVQTQFDRVSFQICVGFCGVKRVWVWFGLCRSELMVLLKPDSVWIFRPFVVSYPNESGCYRHGFLFCFELGPCQFWGSEMNQPIIPRVFTSLWLLLHSPSPTQPPPTIVKLKPRHGQPCSVQRFRLFSPNCHFMLDRLHPVLSVLFLHTLAAAI